MSLSKKIELHDGINPVRKIAIMGLFKDNSEYLDWLFPQFMLMESMYDVCFRYFPYENNSKDDTATKWDAFLSTRKGHLLSECLTSSYINKEYNFERVKFLAGLRNKLLEASRLEPDFTESDWCLMIDSNVYFEPDTLVRMFALSPCTKNIAMLTACTQEVTKNPAFDLESQSADHRSRQPFLSYCHYYDTYAVVDVDDKLHYPMCRFDKCQICNQRRKHNNVPVYVPDEFGLVDVRSAFAGFVLIPIEYMMPTYVEWRTTEMKFGELSLCEHVYFADMIKIASNKKRIVIASTIDDLNWVK
jgi:hypothetical protein